MGKTALIVDDSRSARVVLKRVLETHSLNVDTAESAEQALEYLNEYRPDVIFMDHMMPGMDGLEAVTAIKNNPDTATIPIMMYTSQKGEVYVGQARALGAVGVLPKEVEPVEVSKVLSSLHVIGDASRSNDDSATEENQDATMDSAALESLDVNLRGLIEDLFDQQRAILRRDMLDSYELIASRVVDEVRTPASGEENERPDANRLPFNVQVLIAALVILVLVFGWLYWERERGWRAVLAQNNELLSALEQQKSIEVQGSVEAQQQLDEYQQSLGNVFNTALRAMEWRVNQAGQYQFGEMPLSDSRVPVFEALQAQLSDLGFYGRVQIEIHVGDLCLTRVDADGYVMAEGNLPVGDCDLRGIAASGGAEASQLQSVAFANFVNASRLQSGGQIEFNIVSVGNGDPLVAYPADSSATTADIWNAIAVQNNRVNVTLIPSD